MEELIGKTILAAEVDGFGIKLVFDDGSIFNYSASDGGYSTYDFTNS